MTNKDSINKILSRLENVRNEIESIRRDLKFILEKEGNQNRKKKGNRNQSISLNYLNTDYITKNHVSIINCLTMKRKG